MRRRCWRKELIPYRETLPAGPKLQGLIAEFRRDKVGTNDYLVEINQRLQREVKYLIRLEPGVQTCEEDADGKGSGSCRDSAGLMVQLPSSFGPGGPLHEGNPATSSSSGRRRVTRRPFRPARRTSPTCTPGPRSTCRGRAGSASTRPAAFWPAKATSRWPAPPTRFPPPPSMAPSPGTLTPRGGKTTSARNNSASRCRSCGFTKTRA